MSASIWLAIFEITLESAFFLRASLYKNWNSLTIATCDTEIINFSKKNDFPAIITSNTHTRALDRVAEAAILVEKSIKDDDIVVCVQGDEPMLEPEMIDSVISPLLKSKKIPCTVLAMHIEDEKLWLNKDTDLFLIQWW